MSEASLWLPEGAQTPGFQRVCSDLNKLGNGLNGDSVICSVMGEFAQIKCSWGNLTSIFPARQHDSTGGMFHVLELLGLAPSIAKSAQFVPFGFKSEATQTRALDKVQ